MESDHVCIDEFVSGFFFGIWNFSDPEILLKSEHICTPTQASGAKSAHEILSNSRRVAQNQRSQEKNMLHVHVHAFILVYGRQEA